MSVCGGAPRLVGAGTTAVGLPSDAHLCRSATPEIEPLWRKAKRFAVRNSGIFKEIGKVAAGVALGVLVGDSLKRPSVIIAGASRVHALGYGSTAPRRIGGCWCLEILVRWRVSCSSAMNRRPIVFRPPGPGWSGAVRISVIFRFLRNIQASRSVYNTRAVTGGGGCRETRSQARVTLMIRICLVRLWSPFVVQNSSAAAGNGWCGTKPSGGQDILLFPDFPYTIIPPSQSDVLCAKQTQFRDGPNEG